MNIINSLNMKAFGIIFLISFFIYIFSLPINTTKTKYPICDSEKQSKFILECLKEDKTNDVLAFGACKNISIELYCK